MSFRKPTSRCGKVVIRNCEVLYHGCLELPYLVVAAHKTDDDCLLFSPLHAIHRADLELRTMYRAQEGSEKCDLSLISGDTGVNGISAWIVRDAYGVITAICEGSTPAPT